MTTAAGRWLNGVPVESSRTLFFLGSSDSAVRSTLSERGWSGRLVCLKPPHFTGAAALAPPLVADSDHPVIAMEPEVVRAHREAAKRAAGEIGRAWFGARANQDARRRNAPPYLLNTLRNVPAISSEGDVAELAGACTNLPALVVGAGPSLDDNLREIGRFRDRVVLIAADTALRPLLSAGIEPEFVVSADPSETNARHLCDLPRMSKTALIAEGSVDPVSLKAFQGRTFFFRVAEHQPWPWLRAAGLDRGLLRSWGSVLTSGYDLALSLGCSRIVFAGADLAFTGGRPYARGTTFEETWYRDAMWGVSVENAWQGALASWPDTREPDVNGRAVATAPHLRSFRDWIAADAAKQTKVTIVNGTGGGILLGARIEQLPLERALEPLPPLTSDVRDRAAARWRTRATSTQSLRRPDGDVLQAWEAFTGGAIDAAACLRALGHDVAVATSAPIEVSSTRVMAESANSVELNLRDGDLLAQIESAWQAIETNDRLMLNDCTSDHSGSEVRRALFAFLESRPGLSARHGRFFDPADTRSWIDRRPVAVLSPGEDRTKWEVSHADIARRLVPLIVEVFNPASVLDVGCGAGAWLPVLQSHGVTDVEGVENGVATYCPVRRFDVSLCLGLAHRVPMHVATAAIEACTAASDTVVFSVPAAGIGAPGFINERPWPVWHREFLRRGFAPCDELRPLIESRLGGLQSPFDLAVVYRRVTEPGESIDDRAAQVFLHNASRADDQVLFRHWQRRAAEAATAAADAARVDVPAATMVELTIPPDRMEASATPGERLFRYRSVAAAQAATREPQVSEDGASTAAASAQGGMLLRSTDGTDPRRNGRRYAVRVPAHIAWIEQQSLLAIVEHRL